MIVSKRLILVTLGLVLITPFICAQSSSRTGLLAARDIRLVMNPLDQFSRAFGLRDERIEEAAQEGLAAYRFRPNESSDLVLSISVIPLAQQEEDLYSFRIEVHGGTSLEKAAGKEFSPEIIGDIPAVKNITVPWNDEDRILSATRELAAKVALELRKALRRKQSTR